MLNPGNYTQQSDINMCMASAVYGMTVEEDKYNRVFSSIYLKVLCTIDPYVEALQEQVSRTIWVIWMIDGLIRARY